MSERVVRRLRGLEDLPLKGDEKEISQGKSLLSLDNFFTPRAISESKTWSFIFKAGVVTKKKFCLYQPLEV